MSEQSIQRPTVVAVFDAFIEELLADPVTAPLTHDANWSMRSSSLGSYIQVIQHVHAEDPQAVLSAVAWRFGGEFAVGGPASPGTVWHELETTWEGVQLTLKLAAPGMSAEDALRARVAELEQQLAAGTPPEPAAVRTLADAQGGAV
ncbi:hypothetical protein NMG29_06445 [Streptomyces cocklensis]|uniref:Uncharacterized protein n=1 Tax=Actinacidiphila cocklensis TaxID=887465 RepID=A0A9W4DJU5_9ACTN|nr:hypothetical protein [Actinacidiphila cocklensis]MDD1057870.1 hypothetical protein [Actinacidiphila cocklensis]CAG6392731.1 hypothetical protein SCOCK_180109 [Actinacidiphila cocklensis]